LDVNGWPGYLMP